MSKDNNLQATNVGQDSGKLSLNDTAVGLREIVSDIKEATFPSESKKPKEKPSSRPLPSFNVMKARLKSYFLKQLEKDISAFKKLKSNPYDLNIAVDQARNENRMITDFPYKDLDEVKNAYLRFFGFKHGMADEGKK